MDLTKFMRHSSEYIRNMTQDEVFELHRNTYILPEGKTYDEVVSMYKELMSKLQLILTNEQLNFALSAQDGHPIICEACPGSGKTTVSQFIVVADIVIHGVNPYKMLLTSFSQQSALSMQERNLRYSKQLGITALAKIKTMHSWYYSFLKEYFPYLNFPKHLTELGSTLEPNEAQKILRNCYVEVTKDKYATDNLIGQIYSLYQYINDAMIANNEAKIKSLLLYTKLGIELPIINQIFNKFNVTKLNIGRLDFVDMQVQFYNMVKKCPDIANRISNHFEGFLIDEAQDTSRIQLANYSKLVNNENRKRVRIIGDVDQAIYRWRGTSQHPFEDFFKVFPDAELVTLGYNMRSGHNIIKHSNQLIRHTKNRVDKNMVSPRNIEDRITVLPCKSRIEAVNKIAEMLKTAYTNMGTDYTQFRDHCVLVRNNNQAMWLADRLLESKVPIKLIGGKFPYNDKIITDLIDCISAVLSPNDSTLGVKILPKLCKDINSTHNKQILMQMNLGKKLYEVEFSIIPKHGGDVPTFTEDIEAIKELCLSRETRVSELCKVLIPLYRKGSYDFYAKKQSIDSEHYESIFEYMLMQDMDINAFNLKLKNIRDTLAYNEKMDLGFRISTMHAVKGDEYKNVYLLDCSSKTCPDAKKLKEYPAKLAYEYLTEERNLFYVAMTRAISNLIVTYNIYSPSLFVCESGLLQKEHGKYMQVLPNHLLDYIHQLESGSNNIVNHNEIVTSMETYREIKSQVKDTPKHKPVVKSMNESYDLAKSFKLNYVLPEEYLDVLNRLQF